MIPVIDVHAHIFSARDIPLKGYLKSRKYTKFRERLFGPLIIPMIAKCLRKWMRPQMRKPLFCKPVLWFAYKAMGKQYRHWASTLAKNVPEIADELVDTFEKDDIDLYVPLVIDYEYWFENTLDTPIKDQIKFIAVKILEQHQGMMHPFVAFDPARELAYRHDKLNPDGRPELWGSLDLVKEAIEKMGFIGVKLYNAMGYRPYNNTDVDDDRKKIPRHKEYYNFTGEQYDEVLGELYDYCVAHEVPITTHCSMGGVESYHDASFIFGQAKFWRDVLNQERWKDLHLNLAHFGWNAQQGYRGHDSWVIDICEMLQDYNHLYTDVSHHRVIGLNEREKFKAAYKDLVHEYPLIKERLLFGIDWHVIKRVKEYGHFKDAYIDVLTDERLFTSEEIAEFIGGNALRFLGLLPGHKNHTRLEQFYQIHHIEPPGWFEGTKQLVHI